jgi:hypothetical protein
VAVNLGAIPAVQIRTYVGCEQTSGGGLFDGRPETFVSLRCFRFASGPIPRRSGEEETDGEKRERDNIPKPSA